MYKRQNVYGRLNLFENLDATVDLHNTTLCTKTQSRDEYHSQLTTSVCNSRRRLDVESDDMQLTMEEWVVMDTGHWVRIVVPNMHVALNIHLKQLYPNTTAVLRRDPPPYYGQQVRPRKLDVMEVRIRHHLDYYGLNSTMCALVGPGHPVEASTLMLGQYGNVFCKFDVYMWIPNKDVMYTSACPLSILTSSEGMNLSLIHI